MLHDFWMTTLRLVPWALILLTIATVIFAVVIAIYERTKVKNKHMEDLEVAPYRDVSRIAILIASKNGEKNIGQTVRAGLQNNRNVFVVSDGSTDGTAKEARLAGAKVLALRKNIGKPSALYRAYRHFELGRRYDAVAILDDDVRIEPDFVNHAKIAMRRDVGISVGKNITDWPKDRRWNIWLAVRAYSYWCYQITLRRLQSTFNVMNCISGSNSLYRVEILDQVLDGMTPYIVDDTYWTLETHRLGLGKIVYADRAVAWIQDPTNFRDWYKQNLRWMWGTFQGIFGHRIGSEFNRFHMSYVILITEWIIYVLSGPICLWLIVRGGLGMLPQQLLVLFSGYALWVIGAAISLRRPRLFLFIPAIVMIDFVFRALMVHAFIKALRQRTVKACVWDSPKRFDAAVV